jgi:RepB DNA-primase from phage plasmid
MTEAPSSPLEYALAEAPEHTPINAGVPSRPPIDFEQARDFLAALAPGGTQFTFQTFDDTKAERSKLTRVMHGSLVEWFPELARLSALGAGVFVTVNRTDLKGRREANIVAVRALFADLDGAPLSVLERFGLPPHIIAMTSPSRFHAYWRIYAVETAEFTGLQKRLATLLDGDPSVCDLPRVMRLPGFPHQKDPANPHRVWFQAREHSGPYEAEALRAALAASERNGVRQSDSKLFGAFAGGLSRPPDMKRGYPDGQRTSELLKRAGWCLGAGGKMSEAETIAACLAWNELNQPPLPAEKVQSTVASIALKEARKCADATQARSIIKVAGGDLSREADEAEQALIGARLPIFVRAGALVSPVCEEAPAAKDRTTIVAKLRKLTVDGIIDWLSRYVDFQRFDERKKKWVSIDPPERVAKIILSRAGVGKFPQVAGVITTPTLRPDGSILTELGYDAATRLYLALDPQFTMPLIPAAPTHADALDALALLGDLLSGFPFVSSVDRAVALSGIMTAVLRGALSIAPLHTFRAHTPGTGKSLLVDVAATIATGRRCPVIAAGKTEEETEKRLGALLRDGVSIVSIDNVSGELGGDALAQMTERHLVRVRILGKSEAPEFECKAAIFTTGNNLVLVGDMVRRAVVCTLDARIERPELREFEFDPIDRVLQNRGAYVAACLTIARAYKAAGAPEVCRPLGSYGEWSDMVRAPLTWLGEADPVDSMETAREEDPELSAIRELFGQLPGHFPDREWTTAELIKIACERPFGGEFVRPEFRDLLLRVAGEGGRVSPERLGKWLSKISGRVVGGLRLEKKIDRSHGNRFSLRPAPRADAHANGGFGGFGGQFH